MPGEHALNELARAIDAGTRVDWKSTESSTGDEVDRQLIRELAVIAAISEVHSSAPLVEPPSPSALAPSVAGTTAEWGVFRLLEKIGEGAHGEVYRAWDTRLDREVALKFLPPELDEPARVNSIIEEGRLLARVRHPNVATIYGAERIDGRIGLWMELVKGQTLEQILERGQFSAAETVTVGLEICRAVSAVHGAGLLHRDIKAHNVMRSEDGRIVLMDFGAGRALADDTPLDLAGTPLYLAPEILQGQPATVRTDVYSIGILLYHLVTGSYPVHAATIRELRDRHGRGERIAVAEVRGNVPPKLAGVITRAIDPRPENRPESADALAAELAALEPRPARGRLTAVAAVAATVTLVAGGWEAIARQTGSSRRPSALLTGLSARPAEHPVIAVLPFKNLSADADSHYFADGFTEGIIRHLAPVQGLQVVSRTSSFAFRDEPRNVEHIREQLGANHVLEGSVLRTGNRLRINARLVLVAGGASVWAEEFNRPLGEIFSVQTAISHAVVNRLQLKSRSQGGIYSGNLEAYDSYLRGQALIDRRGIINVQKAAELFQRAIAIDARFALAHAGLANAYAFLSFPNRGISFEAAFPIMQTAASAALRLDPTLADAHVAIGWVYAYRHDWVNAERSFQQAINLDPSLTHAYTSYSLSTLQPLLKYDEALRLLAVAGTRDPLSLDVQREIGEVQLFAGRYAEAVATLQGVREVDPAFPFVQTFLAQALIFDGRPDEALKLRGDPSTIWPISAYVRTGRRAEAEQLATEHGNYPFRMAIISAALGNTQRALDAIEQVAANEPHRIGRLLIEPELVSLRDHPRVIAVRRAFNLP